MGDTTAKSLAGSQIGPYRLRRLIGRGGMGEVYEAEDTARERIVALKLMSTALSNDAVFRKRMQREARTAGRLNEPHIVPIHDFGEIDGRLYLDMRLIDGADLATMLSRNGPLGPVRAVAIIEQIGAALDAAHAAGVMHRDVKPENILIAEHDFAYLVDFGIASAADDEKLTEMGTMVGTVSYMAPERLINSEQTHRSDVYALACVLLECLTGSPPYQGSQVTVLTGHLYGAIPRPSASCPDIPGAFDQVVARGMAKDPADRYATAGDLARAAHAALGAPDQDLVTQMLRRNQLTIGQNVGFAAPPFLPASSARAARGAARAPVTRSAGPVISPSSGRGTSRRAPPRQGPRGRASLVEPPPRPPTPRQLWPWAAAAIAVLVATVLGGVVWLGPRQSSTSVPASALNLRVLDDGVFVGSPSAATTIDVFNEPICQPCGAFNQTYAGRIQNAVADQKLGVRWHLLAFLDSQSPSKDYSVRAVAATLCVAEQNDAVLYSKFYAALFAADFQPAEGASTDRSDAELAHLAQTLGANADVTTCIASQADVTNAQTKAANGLATMNALQAHGTPFVWDGRKAVDINDPNWLDNVMTKET